VVAASAAIALLVAVWSVAQISIIPPRLTPRALELGTGTTHVLIDTPRSSVLDLRQDTYSLVALTQRATILGNVMANGQVRQAIARRAGVPVDLLQVAPPLTPTQPRARIGSTNQKRATDILESTDQYRLSIQANPTVPMLDIYAQAPTAESAASLANASVDSLRAYLEDVAVTEQTPKSKQIRLLQLGRADGAVINEGIQWQVAFIAFVLTFSIACALLTFLARLRQGWRMAAVAERTAG
jgi:hypothetical protein